MTELYYDVAPPLCAGGHGVCTAEWLGEVSNKGSLVTVTG